eukprot:CAMPEP_0197186406 /NCGR_PEP_ID=MMETSP1423-20130617/13854_1 /TAXON_ID=476441 /ORGANISM="Pseudo-nitzschia heimii, Strain UNC1101" /LENGTH=428 /DNA_ID=CAMNT_0042637717 /DNA_START=196 /DNA_END=1482 /DNA_ORIENTATION=-
MSINSSSIIVPIDDNDDEYELMNEHKFWSSNTLGNMCCSSCLQKFNFDARGDTMYIIEGSAFDIIIVENEDGSLFQNSDFLVNFKGEETVYDNASHKIVMEVGQGNDVGTKAWFPIIRKSDKEIDEDVSGNNAEDDESFDEKRFWGCCHPSAGGSKPNMLSKFDDGGHESNGDASSALKAFLKPGRNLIRYLLLDKQRVVGVAQAYIFLWSSSDSLVVSDIDGTITKSNARGILGTIISQQYGKVCHVGICQLLSRLSSTSQVVYVTSRPLTLANQTRKFLSSLKQGNEMLPEGPLLGFGGNLSQLFIMELVSKTTQRFKSGKLWEQVVKPFRQATNNDPNSPVFVAGFGNNFMDMQSYHSVGMDLHRMFKISKKSQIVNFDKANVTTHSYNGDLDFLPHQWYEDRIGTRYDGYTDSRLISRLFSTKN